MNDREQNLKTEEESTQSTPVIEPSAETTPYPELPEGALILLPTRNAVLFPGIVAPLTLGRPRSIAGAQAAAQADKPIGVLLQSDPSADAPCDPRSTERSATNGQQRNYGDPKPATEPAPTRSLERCSIASERCPLRRQREPGAPAGKVP